MFGHLKAPPPGIDELRRQPTTVSGWAHADLRAEVAWPPEGGRRRRNPLLLLGHPGGWDALSLQEVVDLDARRTMSASNALDHRTCLLSDVDGVAPDSVVGAVTRGLAPGTLAVVGCLEAGPRQPVHLHTTTTRDVVAHLASWAAGTAAARDPR